MSLSPRAVFVVLIAASASCVEGTETDNPANGDLVGFEDSGCKSHAGAARRIGTSTEALVDASEYDGLNCIAWQERDDEALTVSLSNLRGPCGVSWRGQAFAHDDRLELVLENPACQVARCGSCVYDLRFEVARVGDAAGLPVAIGFRDCPGQAVHFEFEMTLPDTTSESGILCRYADRSAYDALVSHEGRCGEVLTPCGTGSTSCGVESEATCAEGLSCVETTSAEDSRCLAACSENDDCVPSGVSQCIDGLCRIPDGW